ncbi:TPA: hypothetical protein ACH3X2_005812 [Trebouxia sp. C0005]
MGNDATDDVPAYLLAEPAGSLPVQTDSTSLASDEQTGHLDEKHLSRITPRLKTRYNLHPSGQPENMSAGVNMTLLAYAGPYKAIGQSIREPLQSAQTALKMTAEIAAEQVRVQRAAAALAQRKATARAAAEEAQQSGQGLKGPKHKQGPSSSFMTMSRDQRQRPASALASSSSKLGPGWYHVRHTATEKQPHAVHLKPHARPTSATGKPSAARSGRPEAVRQTSSRSSRTANEGGTNSDGPPLLVLPTKGSRLSAEPSTPGKNWLRTNPDSPSAGKGFARTSTNMSPDMLQQTLGQSTTIAAPDFLRQTLGRTNTSMGADFLRQTLGRTNTNMGSAFLGRTLGRATTGMGSMAFANTMGRTGAGDFGMTMPPVPPLLIDPLVTAMMQKGSADVPVSQPRSTSPAFLMPGRGRVAKQVDTSSKHAGAAAPAAGAAIAADSAVRRRCTSPVVFHLQTRRPQGSGEGQGKAHLAPGMYFKDLETPEEHMRAGHPQSLQNLDFGKHTPRAPLAKAQQEEEPQNTDQPAPAKGDQQGHQQSARSQSAVGHSSRPRRLKRPMSAWAEMPTGGAPCIAWPRPASALPFASRVDTSSMAADDDEDSPHLFWTPPKAWMLALMDKGQPLRKKAHSASGGENDSREQWAAAQADVHSLESFCYTVQPTRPASAQSPYSPAGRGVTHIRPSSAAPRPQARPRTPQLWSLLTDSQQDARGHKGCAGSTQPGKTAGADCAAAATASVHSVNEELGALSSNAAAQQTAHGATRRSKSALGARPKAAARQRQTRTVHGAADKSSSSGQTEATAAAAKVPAATRARPSSAQPQAKSPGSFLRNARPQSAAAANVANHARPRSPTAGLYNFNEPKRESGWVDFRAQNRMGKRVHGGAISAVTRMEALHSMRPLTQTQGPFELTGPSPLSPYLTAKYEPHDEVRSHRLRPPSWALPPNRSVPKWRGTVHRAGAAQVQQGRNRNGWQQEWQKWVQVAASNLHQRPA